MRYILVGISLSLLLGPSTTLQAQTRLDISISSYPSLILIPGYPVYYDPAQQLNYFFYGGRYWVFHEDGWYYSNWYNGPWTPMAADRVPVFIWRIPLRYYHHRPAYFQGRSANEAPPWDQHWGAGWSRKHPDWQQWNRKSVPPASQSAARLSETVWRQPLSAFAQAAVNAGASASKTARYRPRSSRTRHSRCAAASVAPAHARHCAPCSASHAG
ncbi:hypothetical protein [Chromobacterium haemolyticum]|uniref:hypothetical protein n=1 Tax=Chromobacterium haemolyticum TaxID=394935 RepID=UPI0012DD5620|nr:hypothetical protein [Chromobacterium haemolyticum]